MVPLVKLIETLIENVSVLVRAYKKFFRLYKFLLKFFITLSLSMTFDFVLLTIFVEPHSFKFP